MASSGQGTGLEGEGACLLPRFVGNRLESSGKNENGGLGLQRTLHDSQRPVSTMPPQNPISSWSLRYGTGDMALLAEEYRRKKDSSWTEEGEFDVRSWER